jgi:hypothetical protein
MTMSTDLDIQEYFPDLYNYGIQDFSAEHAKTRGDIIRRLKTEWWPRKANLYTGIEMDTTLITESQFTRAAVFHCLSYYILPKLTQFSPDGDRWEKMMAYYKSRYEEEFTAVINDGVEYDADNDGVVEINQGEKSPLYTQRLVR